MVHAAGLGGEPLKTAMSPIALRFYEDRR
jgi:hypothetical protein